MLLCNMRGSIRFVLRKLISQHDKNNSIMAIRLFQKVIEYIIWILYVWRRKRVKYLYKEFIVIIGSDIGSLCLQAMNSDKMHEPIGISDRIFKNYE